MNTDLTPPIDDREPSAIQNAPHSAAVCSAPTVSDPEDLLSLPAITRPPGRSVDLSGKVFGRLTATHVVGRSPDGAFLWLCRCSCGKYVAREASRIRRGAVQSCGCLQLEAAARNADDLSGQTFGRLLALAPMVTRIGGSIVWCCKCSCGAECTTTAYKLRSGETRSCGCLRREKARVSMLGRHARESYSGDRCPAWKPELTSEDRDKSRGDMPTVRNLVFRRDRHTCTVCGSRRGLNGHHMEPWSKNKELRYDLDNIVTLCDRCHRLYHRQYPAKIANTENFIAWFRQQKLSLKKDIDLPTEIA